MGDSYRYCGHKWDKVEAGEWFCCDLGVTVFFVEEEKRWHYQIGGGMPRPHDLTFGYQTMRQAMSAAACEIEENT